MFGGKELYNSFRYRKRDSKNKGKKYKKIPKLMDMPCPFCCSNRINIASEKCRKCGNNLLCPECGNILNVGYSIITAPQDPGGGQGSYSALMIQCDHCHLFQQEPPTCYHPPKGLVLIYDRFVEHRTL